MEFIENDLPNARLPQEIQGNIVLGFRRTHTELVFGRFRSDDELANLRCLSNLWEHVGPFVVSASDHEAHAGDDAPLANLMLTAQGMTRLGKAGLLSRMDEAFRRGSRDPVTVTRLNDRHVNDWDPHFRAPWDVLVLIAHNASREVASLVRTMASELDGSWEGLTLEGRLLDAHRSPLQSPKLAHYEPFGYRDGISNPVFTREVLQRRASKRVARPTSFVLADDPLARGSYGTYFVFRYLAQDVAGFDARLEQLVDSVLTRAGAVADDLGVADPNNPYRRAADLAASCAPGQHPEVVREEIKDILCRLAMGRDKSGHPHTQWDRPFADRATPAQENDFDFDDDRGARVCPFKAHIRKANPRGQTGAADEADHGIVRRGMPYLHANGDMGLLFLCAQSDIENQFEFMQRYWINDEPLPEHGTQNPTPGHDSIAAQAQPEDWVVGFGADFYNLVSLRGSEYLFAPSLPGIERLLSEADMPSSQSGPSDGEKPKGLVSLCHHVAQIPAYNFNNRTPTVATLPAILSSFGVGSDAGKIVGEIMELSRAARAHEPRARTQMKALGAKLWKRHGASELANISPFAARRLDLDPEILKTAEGGGAVHPDRWLLLDYVYAYLFFPNDKLVHPRLWIRKRSPFAGYVDLLEEIRLQGGASVEQTHLDDLCAALSDEYGQDTFDLCW